MSEFITPRCSLGTPYLSLKAPVLIRNAVTSFFISVFFFALSLTLSLVVVSVPSLAVG